MAEVWVSFKDYLVRLNRWRSMIGMIKGVRRRDSIRLYGSALFAIGSSLQDLKRWQDPALLWDAFLSVDAVGQFNVRRRSDDFWHVFPGREPAIFEQIATRLKPGDVFIDAGANIGFYTLFASRLVGPEGQVIAVEMMRDTAAVLRSHLALNNVENCSVCERALSDKAGQEVTANVPERQFGQASIATEAPSNKRSQSVTTTTLADLIADHDQVALIKMDLEGAEESALKGAGDALTRVAAVIFEDWGSDRLIRLFEARGFVVERIDPKNSIALNPLIQQDRSVSKTP